MSTTYLLYQRWKALKGPISDRQAAIALGVSHQSPQHWKNGHNGGLDIIERMAKDLGEDLATLAIACWEETTKDPAAKKVIQKVARRLGSAAVIALALTGPTIQSAKASSKSTFLDQQNSHALYIMRSRTGWMNRRSRRRHHHRQTRTLIAV